MTKIILADNTEMSVLVVNGVSRHIQGVNRDSLEFVFTPNEHSLDELATIFSDVEKTHTIKIVDGEGVEHIYKDYTIAGTPFVSLSNHLVAPETSDSPATYEQRISVTIAQETYSEKLIKQVRLSLSN